MKNLLKSAQWQKSMAIKLDFNGMMQHSLGEYGITLQELENNAQIYRAAAINMEAKRGQMCWRDLPFNQKAVVEKIKAYAKNVQKDFDAFVVLGIGGSALGTIALQQALCHLRYNDLPKSKRNTPKLYVEDNIDPERIDSLFDIIDIEKTAFCVITKSGSTVETMAQLVYVTNLLKQSLGDGWQRHVVAITDENKGSLIKFAKQNNIETFFVPDGVGGRFSVLCPVGLLPLAVCGVDIDALLLGAEYMDNIAKERDYVENPAYMAAILELCAVKRGHNISVIMPYADSLKYMADWYCQLWAESLGKKYDNCGNVVHIGQTPVKALGVTDQHSQIQLYTQGPFDKVVTFIAVENYRSVVKIPNCVDGAEDASYLSGHTFNRLIDAECRATQYALTKSGHMNKTITLPQVNEFTIGQLLYMFELQTAFAGELLNINAFDQPGVEAGKNAAYAMLGRKGYDDVAKELATMPLPKQEFIV